MSIGVARAGRALPAPWSAEEVAACVGGELVGPTCVVSGVAELAHAGPDDVAYAERAGASDAGLLLAAAAIPGRVVVVCLDPKDAFITFLEAAFDDDGDPAIHPAATVHPTATIGPGVRLGAGVRVGAHCVVGEQTVLFDNVVLYPHTRVGARCRVHAGAVLGADGFSYHPGPRGLRKVPQVGCVVIADDVEIGANTTIDRAFLGETRIGAGSKLDNLVQIGHNSRLGPRVLIAGQSGLSGSVEVGAGVMMGGQVGVADHARIGDGARLGARSGIHGVIASGQTVFGAPALPIRLARRVAAALPRLPELLKRVRALERAADTGDESGET